MKNNIETEVKIEVDERTFERALYKLNGPLIECSKIYPKFVEEINTFYKVPNGFLRLRKYGSDVSVTYKGKRQKSEEFNSREEIEFRYSEYDLENLKLLFTRMGLEKELEYTKKRHNFSFDDGPIASFDIMPNGKRYIEIEDNPETIRNIIELLELGSLPIEKRSYLEIMRCEDGKKV